MLSMAAKETKLLNLLTSFSAEKFNKEVSQSRKIRSSKLSMSKVINESVLRALPAVGLSQADQKTTQSKASLVLPSL